LREGRAGGTTERGKQREKKCGGLWMGGRSKCYPRSVDKGGGKVEKGKKGG